MFFICLDIDGQTKYLYNWRCAVFLPDYAKRFPTLAAAKRYMREHQVCRERRCWIVELTEEESDKLRGKQWHFE